MRLRALAGIAVLAGTLTACGHSVSGNPGTSEAGSGGSHPDYPKLMQECQLVAPDTIDRIINGDVGSATFTGAICRWDATSEVGTIGLTLNWFESGSLTNERTMNQKLGYQVTPIQIQGGAGLQEKRPNDPDSCGVTVVAADSGVIGWWVQYTPGSGHPDPCQPAQQLAAASTSLSR
jgi:hypothetical protein